MTNAKRILGRAPTVDEIHAVTDALWDNAVDGRLCGVDFERAERELRSSFLRWLASEA